MIMIQPDNCPYKGLSARVCSQCVRYIPDTDSCALITASVRVDANTALQAATSAQSYQDRLRRYEEDRRKLLELSKEALVDLILKRPDFI